MRPIKQRIQRLAPAAAPGSIAVAGAGAAVGWWLHDAALLIDYGWLPLLGRSVFPSVLLTAILVPVAFLLFRPGRVAAASLSFFVLLSIGYLLTPRLAGVALPSLAQAPPGAPAIFVGLVGATWLALLWRPGRSATGVSGSGKIAGLSAAFWAAAACGCGFAAALYLLRLGDVWSRAAVPSILVLVSSGLFALLQRMRGRGRLAKVGSVGLCAAVLLLAAWRERDWRKSSVSNEFDPARSAEDGRAATKDTRPPTNLVLITLDTVRAQNLFVRNYRRSTMPRLARWVREHAVSYTDARSASSWTWPSHVTLFSGLTPAQHRATHLAPQSPEPPEGGAARDRLFLPLAREVPLLAEELAKQGYATGAVVANAAVLNPATGIGRGFSHYSFRAPDELPLNRPLLAQATARRADLGHKPYLDAAAVRLSAERWLAGVEQEPFFLFVNFFDAHKPWIPHDSVRSAFEARQPSDPLAPGRRDIELLYDRELLYMDRELARLLEAVERREDAGRTLVVITSDHGEAFGRPTSSEASFWGHAKHLYEDLVAVPLFVRLPSLEPATVHRQVDAADVVSMILADMGLVGLLPEAADAAPVLLSVPTPTAEIYRSLRSRQDPAFRDRLAWVLEDRKVIVDSEGRVEVFDLRTDPWELSNQVTEAERAEFAAMARAWWDAHPRREDAGAEPALDKETLKRLKSLGYLGGGL